MPSLEPPSLWPSFSNNEELSCRTVQPPWVGLVAEDTSLIGVVWGLDDLGVRLLFALVEKTYPSIKAKLVVAVYAASPTTAAVLRSLSEIPALGSGRVEIGVIAVSLTSDAAAMTALCFLATKSGRSHFWIGNSGNLGCGTTGDGHLNLLFEAQRTLVDQWMDWFASLWTCCAPLTPLTADVPALVAAKGSEEAAERWRQYERLCRQLGSPEKIAAQDEAVAPSPERPQVAGQENRRQVVENICHELGVRPPDELQEKVSRLLAKGQVVIIDKSTRTPPLELPVRPELLDVPASRKVGAWIWRSEFRIPVFDEQESRKLEARRKRLSEIIKRLTYPLADGVRWLPLAAQPLLEREREWAEKEAKDLIRSLIGQGPKECARLQREQIAWGANNIYAGFHPGERLPERSLNLILRDLEDRLRKATEGSFLPKVSYSTLQFSPRPDSEHVSSWAQARTFLAAVAEYGRKAVTEKVHIRGLQIPEEELLEAMDVCGDRILREIRDDKLRHRAKKELLELEEILAEESDDRSKCGRIPRLIEGTSSPVGGPADEWVPPGRP